MARKPWGRGAPANDGTASLLRRLSAEGLRVSTPEDVGESLSEVRRGLVSEADRLPSELLPLAGLSALALGWFQGAADLLARSLEEEPPPEGREALPAAIPTLAAQYGLWTGDLRTVSGLAGDLEAAVARAVAAGRWAPLRDLVRALEPGGKSLRLEALRARAGVEPSTGRHATGWSALLTHFALPEGQDPEGLGRPGALARLLEEPDQELAGTLVAPAALVRGLLGAEADAGYGRLLLAPRLPRSWTRLELHGISMGDVAVGLDYRVDAGGHRFLLRQDRGRVPVNLVFAPEVPWPDRLPAPADGGGPETGGPGPRGGRAEVRLNGEVAEAEVTASGPRVRVRLQVPLDRDTEITVG